MSLTNFGLISGGPGADLVPWQKILPERTVAYSPERNFSPRINLCIPACLEIGAPDLYQFLARTKACLEIIGRSERRSYSMKKILPEHTVRPQTSFAVSKNGSAILGSV